MPEVMEADVVTKRRFDLATRTHSNHLGENNLKVIADRKRGGQKREKKKERERHPEVISGNLEDSREKKKKKLKFADAVG